jgi:exopolysaccharide biosynthesis polyprenyl glycosylphosphotransferase
MSSYITPPRNPELDLRAPEFTSLRKGSIIACCRVLTLLLLDAVILALSWQFVETQSIFSATSWGRYNNPFPLLPTIATAIGFIAAVGLYGSGEERRDYLSLMKALTLSQVLLFLITVFYQPSSALKWPTFIFSWVLSTALICVSRFSIDFAVARFRSQGAYCYPAVLICHPEDTKRATGRLKRENRYNLLGCINISDLDSDRWEQIISKICVLGASDVFLCSRESVKNVMFFYWNLRNAGITLHILPISLEVVLRQSQFLTAGRVPFVTFSPPLITGIDFWVKRGFDFCCALLLLIVASPIYLVIALLIRLDSPGPVFYKQVRVGLRGRQFKVWKFRTMFVNADQMQKELEALNETKDGILFKIKDDPRVTRVGKFLRQYSLDELPQVFNVLFGQMSLVGPRPLPMRDVEKFAAHHFIRHEVLPGISGLWQVSGRSDVDDFEDVVKLDVAYIQNWSLWLDLEILLRTVKVVLKKTGAY